MSAKLTIKQGEAKTVILTLTDQDGVAVDISGATLLLGVKKDKSDATYSLSKEDDDFDKDLAASGIVAVGLTGEDTDLAEGVYTGELKCSWDGPPAVVEKSADFFFKIKAAVTA